jgi:hypothetical protein
MSNYQDTIFHGMHSFHAYPFLFQLSCTMKEDVSRYPLEYTLNIFNSSDTYLPSSQIQSSNNDISDSDLFPIAVRYHDPVNNVYVIERPPFELPIDFYLKKGVANKKVPAALRGRKIYIPWTVYVFTYSNGITSNSSVQKTYVFFNDQQLNSLDDIVIPAYTPNVFVDGSVCYGNTYSSYLQRINSGEITSSIADFFNYLLGDYFNDWNTDISINSLPTKFDYFKKVIKLFDRPHDKPALQKSLQEQYPDMMHWGNNKNGLLFFLYSLSRISYQETMDFITYLKSQNYNHNGPVKLSSIVKSLSNESFSVSISKCIDYSLSHSEFSSYANYRPLPFHYSYFINSKSVGYLGGSSDSINTRQTVSFSNPPSDYSEMKKLVFNHSVVSTVYHSCLKNINSAFEQAKQEFIRDGLLSSDQSGMTIQTCMTSPGTVERALFKEFTWKLYSFTMAASNIKIDCSKLEPTNV